MRPTMESVQGLRCGSPDELGGHSRAALESRGSTLPRDPILGGVPRRQADFVLTGEQKHGRPRPSCKKFLEDMS